MKRAFLAEASCLALIVTSQQAAAQAAPPSAETPEVTAPDGSSPATAASTDTQDAPGREIVVTAQKRTERLLDVPVSVSVVDAGSLAGTNQTRLQDYFQKVPGLSLVPTQNGSSIAIRGVTSGGGFGVNSTVGIVVDDVPFGTSSGISYNGLTPDIDPSDLDSIEILRGPQGTLYGANSIGGLIKYRTARPRLDALSGRVQLGANSVSGSDELGLTARGAINAPLSADLALRASAFSKRDAGYLDNPVDGSEDVNRANSYGGHLSLLWKPAEDVSVLLGALAQDTKALGTFESLRAPGFGTLETDRLATTGGYHRRLFAFNAEVSAALGGADLVSVTGYNINRLLDQRLDQAGTFYIDFAQGLFGADNAYLDQKAKTKRFSEEVRLTVPVGQHLSLLTGLFYSREKGSNFYEGVAADADGDGVGSIYAGRYPTRYREAAAFANLTITFSDRFDVQVGGRQSWTRQSYSEQATGPLVDAFFGGPLIQPRIVTKEDSFTYLLTPRFKLGEDLMLYARVASGYRPGGPNATCSVFGIPCSFRPDKTRNFEAGIKGSVLEKRLTFEASAYAIEWKDIQLALVDLVSTAGFTGNASKASSKGFELEADLRAWEGGTLSGWLVYSDAKLEADLPPEAVAAQQAGLKGDPLLYSSPWSGNIALTQRMPVALDWTATFGASASFVGRRAGNYRPTPDSPIPMIPAYTRFDLNASLRHQSWEVGLYVNNITDKRGITTLSTLNQAYIRYMQPRTVGVTLAKSF